MLAWSVYGFTRAAVVMNVPTLATSTLVPATARKCVLPFLLNRFLAQPIGQGLCFGQRVYIGPDALLGVSRVGKSGPIFHGRL